MRTLLYQSAFWVLGQRPFQPRCHPVYFGVRWWRTFRKQMAVCIDWLCLWHPECYNIRLRAGLATLVDCQTVEWGGEDEKWPEGMSLWGWPSEPIKTEFQTRKPGSFPQTENIREKVSPVPLPSFPVFFFFLLLLQEQVGCFINTT